MHKWAFSVPIGHLWRRREQTVGSIKCLFTKLCGLLRDYRFPEAMFLLSERPFLRKSMRASVLFVL